MAKAPADQWYWKDWYNDVELHLACAASRGVWADLLAVMAFATPKGLLTGTIRNFLQFGRCTESELNIFLADAEKYKFCDLRYEVTDGHKNIIVKNRRMYRKWKEQQSNRLRQAKWRGKQKNNKQDNSKITPPSPSPSSPNHSAHARAKQNLYQKPNEDPRANWKENPLCENCGKTNAHGQHERTQRWLCLACYIKEPE